MLEAIKCAALRVSDGRIVTGINHGFAYASLTDRANFDPALEIEEGFLTTLGRFVGRVEALVVATAALQCRPQSTGFLCSEDVAQAREAGAL